MALYRVKIQEGANDFRFMHETRGAGPSYFKRAVMDAIFEHFSVTKPLTVLVIQVEEVPYDAA
jgi:hypothetical protein